MPNDNTPSTHWRDPLERYETETDADSAYAWRIATALADAADTLGIMHVDVSGNTLTAWHVTNTILAFTLTVLPTPETEPTR
jgi:hypothetical protein